MTKPLSDSEMIRYDRQMMIPGWGVDGQKKLKSSKVVIIGIGGLGSPVAMYLAAAGVGHLLIVDKDRYELSNLNRQLLGWNKDIGRLKVDAAKEKLEAINPEVKVEALAIEVKKENILNLLDGADLAVDGADNWSVRFIVNEGCVKRHIPFIHAGVQGFFGQVTTIVPGLGPCLACIMPRHPPEIERFPVVGVTPGLFAMLEAMEALKMIVGIGSLLIGKILIFNGEDVAFDLIEVHKDPRCPVCGKAGEIKG